MYSICTLNFIIPSLTYFETNYESRGKGSRIRRKLDSSISNKLIIPSILINQVSEALINLEAHQNRMPSRLAEKTPIRNTCEIIDYTLGLAPSLSKAYESYTTRFIHTFSRNIGFK